MNSLALVIEPLWQPNIMEKKWGFHLLWKACELTSDLALAIEGTLEQPNGMGEKLPRKACALTNSHALAFKGTLWQPAKKGCLAFYGNTVR